MRNKKLEVGDVVVLKIGDKVHGQIEDNYGENRYYEFSIGDKIEVGNKDPFNFIQNIIKESYRVDITTDQLKDFLVKQHGSRCLPITIETNRFAGKYVLTRRHDAYDDTTADYYEFQSLDNEKILCKIVSKMNAFHKSLYDNLVPIDKLKARWVNK